MKFLPLFLALLTISTLHAMEPTEPHSKALIRDPFSLKSLCARYLLKHALHKLGEAQFPKELDDFVQLEYWASGVMKPFCCREKAQEGLYCMLSSGIADQRLLDYLRSLNPSLDLNQPESIQFYHPGFSYTRERTPLTAAIQEKNLRLIRFLLDNRADANYQLLIDQSTALHHAAVCGAPEILMLLLEYGANPFIQDLRGYTPRAVALDHDRHTIAQLLQTAEERRMALDSARKKKNVAWALASRERGKHQ